MCIDCGKLSRNLRRGKFCQLLKRQWRSHSELITDIVWEAFLIITTGLVATLICKTSRLWETLPELVRCTFAAFLAWLLRIFLKVVIYLGKMILKIDSEEETEETTLMNLGKMILGINSGAERIMRR